MKRLKVATLNVWNKSGPWPERLALIRAELATLSPDVLGLQEILRLPPAGAASGSALSPDSDQACEIAQGLGYYIAFGIASKYGSGLQFGNALLSRYPISTFSTHPLPGAETGETRSLLHALLDTPYGRVPVFVTHLNWKLHDGAVRLRQVRHLVERVFAIAPASADLFPAIVMGDFNAEPDSDEIRYLRGLHTVEGHSVYFADAWIYAGDASAGYTFDRINRFAALAHEPPRRIDYIFVRGPDSKFRGEPLATRLAFATSAAHSSGELWPSDHFGLITELCAEPRSEY